MKSPPSDEDLRQAYSVGDNEHHRLRQELLTAVMRGDHRQFPQRFVGPGRKWLAAGISAIAASLLIAAGVWLFFASVAPAPAYSFEGLRDRLLKVRSLHVTGWTCQTITVDGQEKIGKFPFELYLERPSRFWHTWNGHSPDEVRTGYRVMDGSRQLFVSHTDKTAILSEASPVRVELDVEVAFQIQWTQRLTGGVPTDYRLAGEEVVNGVRALRYECICAAEGKRTRTVIWVSLETGFPVRSAEYLGAKETEFLSQLNECIETNGPPPRPDLFSFQSPSGYVVEHGAEEPGTPFVPPMAMGGGRESAVRELFSIDDRAILVCWMNQPQPDSKPKLPDAQADPLKIKLELSGGSAKRPCMQVPVRVQHDQDQVWHWSLVVPHDRQAIRLSEVLAVRFASRESQMSFENCPLHFEDSRLEKLLVHLQQKTFSEQPEGESPFTLADLRKQLAEILAKPVGLPPFFVPVVMRAPSLPRTSASNSRARTFPTWGARCCTSRRASVGRRLRVRS
ncbi:MAG TPA: hypothetical protein VGM05_08690 [Planctomycetaceae bacterium]|jgi:hypothetical protein